MTNNPRASREKFEKVTDALSIFERDGKWHANVQHAGKQIRRSLKTASKKQARLNALKLMGELTNEREFACREDATIEEVFSDFLAWKVSEGIAAASIRKYRVALNFAIGVAGEMSRVKIAEVDARFLDRFRASRLKKVRSQKTIFTDLVIIRGAIKFAVSRKLLVVDSLAGYKIPKPKSGPQPCWSPEEVERIIETCRRRPHQDIYAVLADTGLRIGELIHLTWADIDFKQNVIKVRSKEGWRTKTGNERAIPMLARVRELIRKQPRRGNWVFTFIDPGQVNGAGRKVSARRLLDYLQRKLKGLGLTGHLHTFRHSFTSNAIAKGIPTEIVRGMLGHVDRRMLEHYTHISSQTAQQAIRALERDPVV
jgi:integrase